MQAVFIIFKTHESRNCFAPGLVWTALWLAQTHPQSSSSEEDMLELQMVQCRAVLKATLHDRIEFAYLK